MKAFVFADRWFVGADPAAVATVVHDVARWSRWWPSVRSVERAPDAPGGREWGAGVDAGCPTR